MNLNSSFKIPPTVVARMVGAETVILDLESGTYFGLDEVGTRVWQLLQQGKTITETCEALSKEYDIDRATLVSDAHDLASELLEKKLICA